MTTFTSRNVPLVEGTDPADIAARVNPVAQLQHDRPGVSALTTTQRNALTGAELWDGRLILNTTTDRLNRYDSGTTSWIEIADTQDLVTLLASSGVPTTSPATAGVRGTSNFAARADHVHPAPAWAAWTPTLTAGNLGTTGASLTGRWVQIGKTIHFTARGTLGTSFSLAAGYAISLPANRASSGIGSAFLNDVSSNFYQGGLNWGTATVSPFILGTNGAAVSISNTVPFTWVAGDYIDISGTYEAA